MTKAEYAQLRKCMARTTSDNDAEALASIRRANVLLTQHSLTWDKVFDRVVRVVDPMEFVEESLTAHPASGSSQRRGGLSGNPPRTGDEDWERLFDLAMSSATGSFLETLESIYDQWQEKGWMSERQKEVVRNAAE
jgi:hypothetical protein